jgi:hypothetical protein
LIGGMAELEREPHGWRAEFLMALYGDPMEGTCSAAAR